jgi:hypothetical protein
MGITETASRHSFASVFFQARQLDFPKPHDMLTRAVNVHGHLSDARGCPVQAQLGRVLTNAPAIILTKKCRHMFSESM